MDYYQVLGIDKKASKDDVKKAFHRLAHKYHPDKSGGDEKKFKEVNEAYQVLSDDGKRAEYDTYGRVFSGGGGQGGFDGFSAEGGPASGFDFGDFFRGASGAGAPDLEDLFEGFFGGGSGGRQTRRGRDISIDIEISFKESAFGTERKVLISKVGACEDCGGTGGKKGSGTVKCDKCAGRGRLRESRRSILGSFTTERECSNCSGTGAVPKEVCSACRGHGVIKKNEEVKVRVPAGIDAGEMIRLSGMGEAVHGGTPGDLYVKVHVEKDRVFKRVGNDLAMELQIKLSDALLGAVYNVQTLDGEIKLKIPQGINFGEVLRVRERGVISDRGHRGDLLIKILIKMPAKLSKKTLELLEKIREEGL